MGNHQGDENSKFRDEVEREIKFCEQYSRNIIPLSCKQAFISWLESRGFQILYATHDRGHAKQYDFTAWNPVSEERFNVREAPKIKGYARVVRDLFGRSDEFLNEIRRSVARC